MTKQEAIDYFAKVDLNRNLWNWFLNELKKLCESRSEGKIRFPIDAPLSKIVDLYWGYLVGECRWQQMATLVEAHTNGLLTLTVELEHNKTDSEVVVVKYKR